MRTIPYLRDGNEMVLDVRTMEDGMYLATLINGKRNIVTGIMLRK